MFKIGSKIFSLQWDSKAHSFVKSPVLPRKRKPNPRYDYGETAAEFPASAKDDYYEALDLLISSIKTRFSQPSFQTYQNLKTLLLIGLQDVEVKKQLQLLQYHFEGDIDCLQLTAQLPIFRILLNNGDGIVNFHDILNSVKALKPEQRCLISSVISTFKLILLNPATTATAERSL